MSPNMGGFRQPSTPAKFVLCGGIFGGDSSHGDGYNVYRKSSLSKRILPLIPTCLTVDEVLSSPDQIMIITTPRQKLASCPTCAEPSNRIHSRYQRTLHDLPWQGRPVMLRVQARRFRCLNPACPRRTFAEGLTGAAGSSTHRTERLSELQCHLGLALGGEAGARLAERLAMPTSADTLLRLVSRVNRFAEPRPVPRVLAVDDWSWRRAAAMGRSWLIWSAMRWSIFCRIARLQLWLSGCAIIQVSRSSPETVPALMQTAYAKAHPLLFRSPTGGICCAILAMPFVPRLTGSMQPFDG